MCSTLCCAQWPQQLRQRQQWNRWQQRRQQAEALVVSWWCSVGVHIVAVVAAAAQTYMFVLQHGVARCVGGDSGGGGSRSTQT
jgi:hypothetical protein